MSTNKQALREEFQYMQDHYSDPEDRERQVIYIAAEALLDELEAAEKRIAEQRGALLAARSYVMQCARLGDAHARGALQAIDRASGKGE